MSSDRRHPAAVRRISWSKRQRMYEAVRWAAGVLLILVAAGAFSSWAGSTQNCLSCHSSLRTVQGSHAQTECVGCHVPGGVNGRIRFGASWVRMAAIGYLTGSEAVHGEEPRPVDESACVRCHSELVKPQADVVGGVRVGHAHLVDQGVRCERCHDGYGHGGVTQTAARHRMSECMRCHGDPQTETDCGLCHVGNPSDVVSGTRLLQRTWVTGDGTCNGCHEAQLARECIACHGGYEMPHPADWRTDHLYDGFANQDSCWECHSPPDGSPPAPHGSASGGYAGTFCNGCHSYPTPHPPAAQWIRQHGPASRGADVPHSVCEPCHSDPRFFVQRCTDCHHTADACERCHAERDRRRGRR